MDLMGTRKRETLEGDSFRKKREEKEKTKKNATFLKADEMFDKSAWFQGKKRKMTIVPRVKKEMRADKLQKERKACRKKGN